MWLTSAIKSALYDIGSSIVGAISAQNTTDAAMASDTAILTTWRSSGCNSHHDVLWNFLTTGAQSRGKLDWFLYNKFIYRYVPILFLVLCWVFTFFSPQYLDVVMKQYPSAYFVDFPRSINFTRFLFYAPVCGPYLSRKLRVYCTFNTLRNSIFSTRSWSGFNWFHGILLLVFFQKALSVSCGESWGTLVLVACLVCLRFPPNHLSSCSLNRGQGSGVWKMLESLAEKSWSKWKTKINRFTYLNFQRHTVGDSIEWQWITPL